MVDFELKKDDGIVMKEAGYINKIIHTQISSHDEKNNTAETVDEIVMACERGIG